MSCTDGNDTGSQTDLNVPASPDTVPPGFAQYHNLQDLQPLCSTGLSPSIVSGLITRILINHFSEPALIMDPDLRELIWAPKVENTKIRITTNTRFDPKNTVLPALIVKRGPMQSDRKVIGDRVGPRTIDEQRQGIVNYSRFMAGSARVFVLSERDGEAEALAMEVFDSLSFLSTEIVTRLPFHDFQVTNLGELGVLDAMGNKIGVPIDLQFTFEYAWAIKPLAPLVKTIKLDITD